MKKLVMALVMAAFGVGALSPIVISPGAYADHDNCKKGYYFDKDKDKCVKKSKRKRKRKSRGSHG